MNVTYKGAVTFEDEATLNAGLEAAKATITQQPDSIITPDELSTLGLHLTISHNIDANEQQIQQSNKVIETLASHAYSGYIDVTVEGEETRFHAKEIDPTPIEQIEEKMGLGENDR